MQKAALYTSGVIFAAAAVAHLVRLITGFEIVVGGVTVHRRQSKLRMSDNAIRTDVDGVQTHRMCANEQRLTGRQS